MVDAENFAQALFKESVDEVKKPDPGTPESKRRRTS